MCFIVTKKLVSRDTKSVIVSVVTCASFWVGEKQAFTVSRLGQSRRSFKTEIRNVEEE
jgi:hypothetical protein